MSDLPYQYDGLIPIVVSEVAGERVRIAGDLYLFNGADPDSAPDRLRLSILSDDGTAGVLCHFYMHQNDARLLSEQLLIVARRLELEAVEGDAVLDSL
jgi:hypothetical protein